MFKRYLPGTKVPTFNVPKIRPIDVGFGHKPNMSAMNRKLTNPLFKRKQRTNKVYRKEQPTNPNFVDVTNNKPRAPKEPPLPRRATIFNDEYVEKNESVAPPERPSWMDGERRGRPKGSRNKRKSETWKRLERDSQKSWHTLWDEASDKRNRTGKYKMRFGGRPRSLKAISKWGDERAVKEYEKYNDGSIKLDSHKKPIYKWVSVPKTAEEMRDPDITPNWSHLSKFNGYNGRALPPDYNELGSRSMRQDGKRRAKMPGWRISKTGQKMISAIMRGKIKNASIRDVLYGWHGGENPHNGVPKHGYSYYEYRRNRADSGHDDKGRKNRVVTIKVVGKGGKEQRESLGYL
jgi:hypothetical protein